MGSIEKFEWNSAEAQRILKSSGVAADVKSRAERIMNAANSQAPEHGYVSQEPFAMTTGTTDRAYANVYTRTQLGRRMQAKHSTLTQALSAGKG